MPSSRPSVSDTQQSKSQTTNKNGELPPASEAVIIETKAAATAAEDQQPKQERPKEDVLTEDPEDARVVIEDSKTLLERPKRISFSSAVNSATATVTPLESVKSSPRELSCTLTSSTAIKQRQQLPPKETQVSASEDSAADTMPVSPGTPCSQCMREKLQFPANSVGSGLASPLTGLNGGQEFFGSSEECCSTGSGCCNSSCAGSCVEAREQQQPPQQPLSLQVVSEATRKHGGMAVHQTTRFSDCSFLDISAPKVATISCPQFETTRLSKISRSVPDDLPGEFEGGRHLVTFITPSMETIPLEMCQDIPDVLI